MEEIARRTHPRTRTDAPGRLIDLLSPQQQEVCRHLVEGKTYQEIAHALGVGRESVVTHVKRALVRTGCRNSRHLVAWFVRSSRRRSA